MSTNIYQAVTEKIKTSNTVVINNVVETLVQKEVASRTELVLNTLEEVSKLEKELLKLKPDNVQYDIDGKEVSGTYTKATIEARKKATERIEKLTKALNKALDDNDFADLKNVNK